MMQRPLLFYSAWPLGYHNLGAERRAQALADAGYGVMYVAGVGIRNPSLSNIPKLVDRSARKLRRSAFSSRGRPNAVSKGPGSGMREGSVLVAPPRQLSLMRRLNSLWLERQLRAQLGPWSEAVAWVRWPTPELVDALGRLAPNRLVYEAVDAYEATPGITGPWGPILARAERRLAGLADRVIVPGERLAQRYRDMGASVRVIPHGVDLIEWHGWRPSTRAQVVIGFAGTIDARLDTKVLRTIATRHPEWRLRLIGPVQDGFAAIPLRGLQNVTIEPPVPASELPRLVSTFDLGVMPYVKNENTVHMTPVKNLEYLAAGVPAVARRLPALEPYADLLYFADTAEEFVCELERALEERSPSLADARRRRAEEHAWPKRLAEFVSVVDELTGGPEFPEPSATSGSRPGPVS